MKTGIEIIKKIRNDIVETHDKLELLTKSPKSIYENSGEIVRLVVRKEILEELNDFAFEE